jgi:flagellin
MYTAKSLLIGYENLQAAESRIRDTDMANEISDFVKNQILAQASISMIAQANARPQSVLALLR